jgi:molybdate transport system regulatory protein
MTRTPLKIRSALTVETRHGAFSGKRWMQLLAAIGEQPSITAAAKAVGLSYKAAWDAVEAMNNLADATLVERTVGGRGGGGARLTARGEHLVETYRRVAAENARFLQRVNARIAGAGEDLHLIGRLSMLTSARNHFAGKILRVAAGAVNDEVELRLHGGETLVAIVTHRSVEQLGLRKGGEAVALIKASSVIVAVDVDDGKGKPLKLSARNQLAGTVARIERGAVNTEVVIALPSGNSVAAIVTNASAKALNLAVGQAATAVFKASSVILAVSA